MTIMPQEFRRAARRNAILSLISYEVSMLSEMKTRQHSKMLRYFNSTPTRELFAKVMVYAALTGGNYTVRQISELLAISRIAAQKIVQDCVAEGWVKMDFNKSNHRIYCAEEPLIELSEEWLDRAIHYNLKFNVSAYMRAAEVDHDVLTVPLIKD